MKKILLSLICLLLLSFIQKDSHLVLETIPSGINQFSFDFYKTVLAGKDKNLFASPYSISSAFAMLQAGASGATLEELNKTLHFVENQDFHAQYAQHQKALQDGLPPSLSLEIANALWIKKECAFAPEYYAMMQKYYKAKIEKLDFNNPKETCDIINQWTSEKTHGKIPSIIGEDLITDDLRLIITNAIYFKSAWKKSFNVEETVTRPFYKARKETLQAPFMHTSGNYAYYSNQHLQMIELPYTNDAVSMVVVLPKENKSLEKFEQMFTYKNYQSWLKQMVTKYGVQLYLPKFKIENNFTLIDDLQNMGIKKAFTTEAELNKIVEKIPLVVSNVLHKSFVEVNEKGTEAAAVTAITAVQISSKVQKLPEIIVFNANRPFIFLIKDNKTNTILFVGKVVTPL
jgi:serpin B